MSHDPNDNAPQAVPHTKGSPKSWLPFVVSVVTTPIWLLIGLISAGAGYGSYLFAKVLFPYTMLSTVLTETITPPFIVLALLQYPIYGVALSLAKKGGRFTDTAAWLLILHIVNVVFCFLFVSKNFS